MDSNLVLFWALTLLIIISEIHAKRESKIMGGEDAKEKEITYQVSIRLSGIHMCGGAITLFDQIEVIIIAAHRVDSRITHKYTIIAGDLRRSNTSGFEQCRSVARIISHELYNGMTFSNDIATILTDTPFNWTEHVLPIELPYPYQQTTGDMIISGWGTLQSGGFHSDVLQKAKVSIVDDETCMAVCRVCLCGYPGIDALCRVFGRRGEGYMSGGCWWTGCIRGWKIFDCSRSWGKGCAEPLFPGVVNAELSYYIDWIAENV